MDISYIFVFLIATVISFIATIPTIVYAKKFGFVTDKSKRNHPAHTHKGIIPRAGGIPIYIALVITALIFIPPSKILTGILVSNGVLLVLGLFDDYYDVSPYLRFLINLMISTIAVGFGLGIPYISNPFGPSGTAIQLDTWRLAFDFFGTRTILIFADLLAIVWLTWLMNMVNWSKGIDGQLPGFVGITAFFLGLLSERFTSHDISVQAVTMLAFIVSGAYLGFLPFNFYPQRIMPGYGGGAMAGFLLGILSILSFGKVGTAILILAVPMIDAVYTIIRRLKNRQSPFRADWGHLHHRLLEIGWGKRRIAVFYWLISFILGVTSLFLSGLHKVLAFVTTAVVLLFFILLMERMKKEDLVK